MPRLHAVRPRTVICTGLLIVSLAACAPSPTATPLPTLVASLTPSPDVQAAVEATLTALAPTAVQSPQPTPATPTETAVPEATTEATEVPVVVTLPALVGERIPPPVDITLPEGWRTVGYDVLVINDVGSIRGVPLAVYQGPITGGLGTIVLLWGFPNLVNPFPDETTTATGPDLLSDGLRLLRLAVLEQGCNIGTDQRRTYRVGLLAATGTQFSAVDCPELPDTRGWFAGVQEQNLNFLFFAYAEGMDVVDPERVDVFNAAGEEMQAILDTVRFRVPEVTAEAAP